MRYWLCVNNQVTGPFDREKLASAPGFAPGALVCPEVPAGQQSPGWKAASDWPELGAAPAPAAPKAEPRAESPLAMTMRGTLIEIPEPTAAPQEPSAVKQAAPRAEPPLAMTMRGTLIEREPEAAPAEPAPRAAQTQEPAAAPRTAEQKLDDLAAALRGLAEAQGRDSARLERVEKAVLELRSLLFPGAPGR